MALITMTATNKVLITYHHTLQIIILHINGSQTLSLYLFTYVVFTVSASNLYYRMIELLMNNELEKDIKGKMT